MFCILLRVFKWYEVIYMYVFCIVGGVESVKGDIDVCFVYCWGCLNGTR